VASKQTIVMGEVLGLHGVRGVLKVRSFAESSEIFNPNSLIAVGPIEGEKESYRVLWSKPHKKALLVALEGIGDYDSAEALVGSYLHVDKDRLPTLEDGTYYWFELIGLDVYADENKFLGKVDAIFPTGSNDVLVVKDIRGDSSNEVLIPALPEVVLSVSVAERIIRVKLPEGL
jgi:16S rRNA processing protein RimM